MDLFFASPPGLEPYLLEEARALGLFGTRQVPGGVEATGDWHDVWRANLWLRGASRVLVRLGTFRAAHLSTLDKRSRTLPWSELLYEGTPITVEATCRASKIYHSGAAAERVRKAALAKSGAVDGGTDPLKILVRIERDLCTISLDTSGELLHKRGFKQSVVKAPLRETLAALLLRAAGFSGDEPVIDPMCGSGTIPIEAAEIAAGLASGRGRSFALERLKTFDSQAWDVLSKPSTQTTTPQHLYRGYDRNPAAIEASQANAERAGVSRFTSFEAQPLSKLARPEGPPGLVVVNPPYGARIGDPRSLHALYASFGSIMRERFAGWRVALITSDGKLAKASGLPFGKPSAPIPHGSLKIRLYQTSPLGQKGRAGPKQTQDLNLPLTTIKEN